jgi:hypothetical protein
VPVLDRPEELVLEVDLDFVREPEADPDFEPELVLDFVEPERVFELDPVLRDREPAVRELDPRERALDPRDPRDEAPPPSPPSSLESPSDPSSFFPTPTAAAVARPTAAPVATFFGVDIPSEPSSSAIGQSPFASLKDVMNRGTILSRTISGPFFPSHVPAAPAASSASGTTASRAASQPPDAIEVSSVLDPPLPFFVGVWSPFDDPFECESALRAAIAAAPVTAAAAAAFTAVRAPEPPLSVVSSTSFVSFSAIVFNPFR